MPELPEVETIVRDLAVRLVGHTFQNPRLHRSDVLREVTPRRLLRALRGQRVAQVYRRAKHAVFLLEDGYRLVIQPRMTGVLMVCDRALTRDERRHVVMQAEIGEGANFVYRDVRRLGTIWLLEERQWRAYTARIGPEPLANDFDLARFTRQLGGSRQAIKKILMDQRRLAGLGNIYANEALFRAGIDPSRRADRLSPKAVSILYGEVRAVLTEAIAAHGTTLRDYRTGTGESGSFQNMLQVYGRAGQPCVRCGTPLATTHAIDGRATTFCWTCQRSRC